MRLSDLVRVFATSTGLDMWRSRQVLDSFASHIIDSLLDGDRVSLLGLGFFYRRGKGVAFCPAYLQKETPLPLIDEDEESLKRDAREMIEAELKELQDLQKQLKAYGIEFRTEIPPPVKRDRPARSRPPEAS